MSADPIREATIRALANALFAELYRLGRIGAWTWEDIHTWAGELLDEHLLETSRLPTLEEVNTVVQARSGVTGT